MPTHPECLREIGRGLAGRGWPLWISRRPDLEVCGEADDVGEALKLAEATCPDVIVIDIQLKTGNGLDLIKRIKARDRRARILVWSTHQHFSYAQRAIKAGALGYVSKQHATTEVLEAIGRVLDGKLYLPDDLTQRILLKAVRGGDVLATCPEEFLSDRELEVFIWLPATPRSNCIRLARNRDKLLAYLVAGPGWSLSRRRVGC